MFCLSAMSATLRKAGIDPINLARIDTSISVLVDLTGANERIFKSPIPLVYTRLTARFLTIFLTLLPLALWGQSHTYTHTHAYVHACCLLPSGLSWRLVEA